MKYIKLLLCVLGISSGYSAENVISNRRHVIFTGMDYCWVEVYGGVSSGWIISKSETVNECADRLYKIFKKYLYSTDPIIFSFGKDRSKLYSTDDVDFGNSNFAQYVDDNKCVFIGQYTSDVVYENFIDWLLGPDNKSSEYGEEDSCDENNGYGEEDTRDENNGYEEEDTRDENNGYAEEDTRDESDEELYNTWCYEEEKHREDWYGI